MTGPIHRVHPAATGFDGVADAYERARPDYPEAALRAVEDRLDLGPASVVVDLAAGTGKLTRAIRGTIGLRVIAVEPSPGMRREFVAAVPGVPILDGTAERIPLGDASVDAVAVGQAFHWFRGAEALTEIARIVRPGGGLALLWNQRDERVPWVRRFGDLLREVRESGVPSARQDSWREAFGGRPEFGPLEVERLESLQPMDRDGLVDRALSVSFVARLPPGERAALLERVRALARDDPDLRDRPRIEFPYVTELYWTQRR